MASIDLTGDGVEGRRAKRKGKEVQGGQSVIVVADDGEEPRKPCGGHDRQAVRPAKRGKKACDDGDSSLALSRLQAGDGGRNREKLWMADTQPSAIKSTPSRTGALSAPAHGHTDHVSRLHQCLQKEHRLKVTAGSVRFEEEEAPGREGFICRAVLNFGSSSARHELDGGYPWSYSHSKRAAKHEVKSRGKLSI